MFYITGRKEKKESSAKRKGRKRQRRTAGSKDHVAPERQRQLCR